MKIAIYGSGSVGSYYGIFLAAANREVYFIARGVHFLSLRKTGIKIRNPEGIICISSVHITDDPAIIGTVDVVIVAIKLYDTAAIIEGCRLLVGPKTLVISLQNGVTATDILKVVIGGSSLIGGTTYIVAGISEPGLIVQRGDSAHLVFGELDGCLTARVRVLYNVFYNAGINTILTERILVVIWLKLSFLASLSGLTALTRQSIGHIRVNKNIRNLLQHAVKEVVTISISAGFSLKKDTANYNMKQLDALPEKVGSSQLHDLLHNKKLELLWLSGAVTHLGHKINITTPIHSFITSILKSRNC